jgi:hypothetical protein
MAYPYKSASPLQESRICPLLSQAAIYQLEIHALSPMIASQCGNDRPGFGLPSITPGIAGYNYKTGLGFQYQDCLNIQ